jgi:hypothetical protein
MNEHDIKIRKQWLAVLLILPLWNLLYNALYLPSDPSWGVFPVWYKYSMIGASLILPLVFNYIVYLCAYKKPGTKLLTFLLIATPISLAAGLGVYAFGNIPTPKNTYFWVHMVISNGVAIWWCVLNWKMRAINKRLQKLRVLAS